MYNVYFDSGTTNTRMYLLAEDGSIAYKAEKAAGSKDAALAQDKTLLARELNLLFTAMLEKMHLEQKDIGSIWMSGMITSPNGIVEVPHIGVPADVRKLASRVYRHHEDLYFKRDIMFIPGLKSVADGTTISISNVDTINNMRGEETEIMGIMSTGTAAKGTCILILPGSHTQIAVVKDGRVVNIISTITGELFKALKSQTILSASLEGTGDRLDEEMVCMGYHNLEKYGFNRAIYIDRSLLLFTSSTPDQRRSYLEGVLNGGVLQAIRAVTGGVHADAFVCGSDSQYRIIAAIAQASYPELTVHEAKNNPDLPFSVLGYAAVSHEYYSKHPAERI